MSSQSAVRVAINHQNESRETHIVESVRVLSLRSRILQLGETLKRIPNGLKLCLAAVACSAYALTFTVTFSYLSPDAQDVARKQQVEQEFQQVQETKLATRENR